MYGATVLINICQYYNYHWCGSERITTAYKQSIQKNIKPLGQGNLFKQTLHQIRYNNELTTNTNQSINQSVNQSINKLVAIIR